MRALFITPHLIRPALERSYVSYGFHSLTSFEINHPVETATISFCPAQMMICGFGQHVRCTRRSPRQFTPFAFTAMHEEMPEQTYKYKNRCDCNGKFIGDGQSANQTIISAHGDRHERANSNPDGEEKKSRKKVGRTVCVGVKPHIFTTNRRHQFFSRPLSPLSWLFRWNSSLSWLFRRNIRRTRLLPIECADDIHVNTKRGKSAQKDVWKTSAR